MQAIDCQNPKSRSSSLVSADLPAFQLSPFIKAGDRYYKTDEETGQTKKVMKVLKIIREAKCECMEFEETADEKVTDD